MWERGGCGVEMLVLMATSTSMGLLQDDFTVSINKAMICEWRATEGQSHSCPPGHLSAIPHAAGPGLVPASQRLEPGITRGHRGLCPFGLPAGHRDWPRRQMITWTASCCLHEVSIFIGRDRRLQQLTSSSSRRSDGRAQGVERSFEGVRSGDGEDELWPFRSLLLAGLGSGKVVWHTWGQLGICLPWPHFIPNSACPTPPPAPLVWPRLVSVWFHYFPLISASAVRGHKEQEL